MTGADFFIVAPGVVHIPTPADLAARYYLDGEVQHVQVGAGVHLLRPGQHRTMCGRMVDRNRKTWEFPTPHTEGRTKCHVCDRIIHAAANRVLGRARGEWG